MVNQPINKKLKLILGLITLGIIVLWMGAVAYMYIRKVGIYAPYKAQPSEKTNVYYPNGKPKTETGKPPATKTLPPQVSAYFQQNLNQYNQTASLEWGPSTA